MHSTALVVKKPWGKSQSSAISSTWQAGQSGRRDRWQLIAEFQLTIFDRRLLLSHPVRRLGERLHLPLLLPAGVDATSTLAELLSLCGCARAELVLSPRHRTPRDRGGTTSSSSCSSSSRRRGDTAAGRRRGGGWSSAAQRRLDPGAGDRARLRRGGGGTGLHEASGRVQAPFICCAECACVGVLKFEFVC